MRKDKMKGGKAHSSPAYRRESPALKMMKPDYRIVMAKVYTLQKEHQRKLSEMKEEKERLLEESKDLDRIKVEEILHELSQTYRHLGLHLETMERFMEDDVGAYIEEKVKVYESMIEMAEKKLKKIPKRKAEPYRQRILCLKILRDSLYLEGVESSSALYHLAKIDEEINMLENPLLLLKLLTGEE